MANLQPHKTHPIDPASAQALEMNDLSLELVDTDDAARFEKWIQADNRGFHGDWLKVDEAKGYMDGVASRRTTGVYDDTAADPDMPVATVNSWPTPLTVPGGEVDAWAISAVTVAPTHRRRGIARNLLEAELRTAHALGVPVAMLTVSEATIYERFGFAPAEVVADLEIDARKAQWRGPAASGRVQFVDRAQLRSEVDALIEKARVQTPGELEAWPRQWDRHFGLTVGQEESGRKIRAVRYDDAAGEPQGFALYTLKEPETDYSKHEATVTYLLALTPDAYAGLWQHVLDLDLVSTVKVPLRSAAEPVIWQVSDQRAIIATHHDHLWLRILDVPAALSARTFATPIDLTIEVTDDLGFTAGTYWVRNDSIKRVNTPADLTLTVNALSAIYLGGISPMTLTAAGHITEHTPGSAAALALAFSSPVTPWTSIWF